MQIIATVRSIANPIAVLSLVVMGVYLQLNTGMEATRVVRRWAFSIAIGLILINMAEPIVNWLASIK